jgi:hypothetical protein
VGGVTAAAAAGAAAVELVQPPATALADGIGWQTGVVNADNQTFVEPAGGSFPDPTLLTVRLGTAAPYQGKTTANSAAVAAYDTTNLGAAAIYATSINGSAITGITASPNGAGVLGEAQTGTGVFGQSISGIGVTGFSNSSLGVRGESESSFGVYAVSTDGVAGFFDGGQAPLQLAVNSLSGAPTEGAHQVGQFWLDSKGILWVCTVGGTPGTWVRLASVLSGSAGGTTTYLSKPIRLLDTRPGATDALHTGGGPYTPHGSPYPLTIAGASYNGVTISSGALGAIGNVTAIGTAAGAGSLAVGQHGAGSGLAVVRYTANQTVENSFNVGLGSGQVDLAIGGNPANVILDVYAIVA